MRIVSAVVMVVVAGTALWLGRWPWTFFVICIALGVGWEWRSLTAGFATSPVARGVWNVIGLAYVGLGALALVGLRDNPSGLQLVLALVGVVIATDVGAYFTGRTLGGPKIAPRISPSKTWSGLLGGVLAAGIAFYVLIPGLCYDDCSSEAIILLPNGFNWLELLEIIPFGAAIAVIAQGGDFFESWMKRRAGVKDSGRLLPGHGGLFDRVDGLLAVMLLPGLFLALDHIAEFA